MMSYSKAKAELEKEKNAKLLAVTKAQLRLDFLTNDLQVHPEKYLPSIVSEVLKAYQATLTQTLQQVKDVNVGSMQKADYLVNQQTTLNQILALIQKTSDREKAFFDRLEATF